MTKCACSLRSRGEKVLFFCAIGGEAVPGGGLLGERGSVTGTDREE